MTQDTSVRSEHFLCRWGCGIVVKATLMASFEIVALGVSYEWNETEQKQQDLRYTGYSHGDHQYYKSLHEINERLIL